MGDGLVTLGGLRRLNTVTLQNLNVTGTLTAASTEAIAGATTITVASANALAVGPNGTTNPTLQVLTNTASAATGVKITSAAAAAGVAIAAISSGTDENLTINAKGAGTVSINGTATGGITLGRAVTLSSTINKLTLTAPATAATLTVIDGTTVTGPATTGTLATLANAETLTNKTITAGIYPDTFVASATLSRTSSTTLTNVAGMVVTVVPGTYKFSVNAPCVSTANTGIRVGFKLTTTVITSGAISGKGFSAAASEIAAYSTTVTDQALWYDTAAGVDLKIELDGILVIGTGGTMQFQMGQHTSNGDTTSIYAGAYMTFTRIA